MNDRKVVGFFKQLLILFWKNSILFKRNILGTLVEIIAALVFVLILIFLRYFVDSVRFADQTNIARSVFDTINATTNRSLILYYPNNTYVKDLITNAYFLIKTRKPSFNATSFFFVPWEKSEIKQNNSVIKLTKKVSASTAKESYNLGVNIISDLFALVSFPDTYTAANVLPSNVKYSIYTQEYRLFLLQNFKL